MKWKKWLENWDMDSLSISLPFLNTTWSPKDADKAAAWELYIELLTRITTQPLPEGSGDEKTALDSVYSLFPLTRETLKRNGRDATEFAKIAIVVLNQIVRPFTAKWHKLSTAGALAEPARCKEFRSELAALQEKLARYTKMLGDMAGVEDLTALQRA
jgi:hypothetical protein